MESSRRMVSHKTLLCTVYGRRVYGAPGSSSAVGRLNRTPKHHNVSPLDPFGFGTMA